MLGKTFKEYDGFLYKVEYWLSNLGEVWVAVMRGSVEIAWYMVSNGPKVLTDDPAIYATVRDIVVVLFGRPGRHQRASLAIPNNWLKPPVYSSRKRSR